MQDSIQRFLFENHAVRGQVVRLARSYQQIMEQHQYPQVIRQLLGEALVAVCLLHRMAKHPGCLTLQFQGTGDLALLSARCTHDYKIRGYAKWTGILPDVNKLSAALGKGQLVVTFEPEKTGGQRYQSIVEVEGYSIAESLEKYFAQSEQLPTKVIVAMDQEQVTGFLLQVLPEQTEQQTTSWAHVVTLAQTLTSQELLTLDNETLLHRLYHQEVVRLFEPDVVEFGCSCSRAKMANAIALVDRAELNNILEESGYVEVNCEFCGNHYRFDQPAIEGIFQNNSGTSKTIH